ncbi:hypothetical protein ONS95_006241 [Cadophora gregata]|uniref:uncharacterized protein n=1 Tax=Cadophora gregata TaxID=51156 RepID=UPI0026DA8A6E|nr:uncharacterized protein ONS95_006241 [Cadophora gregata]KAK0102637.1 hypothetical protein ONS95_006241 [Cadophora gregata]KAK0104289.1 hypothetical protein ONS96_005379 [Cadophora gregata f. sp. sojae]
MGGREGTNYNPPPPVPFISFPHPDSLNTLLFYYLDCFNIALTLYWGEHRPNWEKTFSAEKGVGVGVYAQFLQLATGGLPLGPEVNLEHSSNTTNTFAFDAVTMLAFEPTEQYLQDAIKAPE